jgi:hypothetical protein
MKANQCWKDFAFPEKRCKKRAYWKSPERLCIGVGEQFMRAVRWCDAHALDGDIPIETAQAIDAARERK